jgi:hypothetical protein
MVNAKNCDHKDETIHKGKEEMDFIGVINELWV